MTIPSNNQPTSNPNHQQGGNKMFRTTARKTLASLATAATAMAAMVVIAQPAAADPSDPLYLGELHLAPTSGK
ncbi:MAG: hypothetical protein LBG60_02020, partial [Bifidobacteriaceae bacterium]|nr:hypothetical protein [Bifidobacteriaceae bacterium]